jgi:hypothetical protein
MRCCANIRRSRKLIRSPRDGRLVSATDRLVEALTADPGQGRGTATALTLGVGNAGQIDVTQRVMKCPHVISICGHLIQR